MTKVNADQAFAALLRHLDSDQNRAARAYERLRLRLIQFLRLHVPRDAEATADIALDRLARRLTDTRIDDITGYVLGIARLLVREVQARDARQARVLQDPTLAPEEDPLAGVEEAADEEEALRALSACMKAEGAEGSRLIVAYYGGGDGTARIRIRRELAHSLGLSLNALRNRALRLRTALERCVRERLGMNHRAGA